jgi:fructokinase
MQIRRDVVLLFGEVLFDVFPEEKLPGGAPLNVARHLRAFGLAPLLITRTGADADRDELIGTMHRFDLDIRGVQTDPVHDTGRVIVEPAAQGHEFRIVSNQAYDFINPNLARMAAISVEPKLFYFGTLAQRSSQSRRALKSLLKHVTAPKFLDINLRKPWYEESIVRSSLLAADVVKVNDEEIFEIGALLGYEKSAPAVLARRMMEDYDLQKLVMTRGAQGAWLLERGGAEYELRAPAVPTRVVDTVGGGDGFSSVLILGLVCGWPLQLTMKRADEFARALCGIRGAIPAEDDFYAPWRREWSLAGETAH